MKFGTDIEDGPYLRTDYKRQVGVAGSRDLISKLSDPLITFERIEQSASSWYRDGGRTLLRRSHTRTVVRNARVL